MRPLRLALRGITRFAQPIDLDLSQLPEGVIALVGDNGAGKSTLLECLGPAAIWRGFVTYPGAILTSVRQDTRDAFLDLTVDFAGHEYRHLLQLDAVGQKGEATLWRDGVPVSERRAGDYDEAVAAIYPPRELFLAGAFSAQDRSGDWLALDRKGRREVFATLLGLGDLQGKAERARELGRDLGTRADALSSAAPAVPDLDALSVEVAVSEARASVAREGQAAAQVAMDAARAEGERLAVQAAEVSSASRAREEAIGRTHALEVKASQALGTALTDEVIETKRLADLREQRAAVGAEPPGAGDLWAQASGAASQATDVGRLLVEEEGLVGRWRAHRESAAVRASITDRTERDRATLASKLSEAGATTREDLATQQQAARQRVADLRLEWARYDDRARVASRLKGVPCRGERMLPVPGSTAILEPVDCGTCPLIADAREAATGLVEPSETLGAVTAEADRLTRSLQEVDELVATIRRGEAALAATPETPAPDREPRTDAEVQALRADVARWATQRDDLEQQARAADGAQAEWRRRTGQIDRDLATAAARLESLRATIERTTTERDEARAALTAAEALPTVDTAAATLALEEARATFRTKRATFDESVAAATVASTALAAARSELERGRQAAERATTARAEVARLQTEARAFGLLERGLGRDGLQALEIDRSGPEVTELLNELLAEVWGPRFRGELRTLQEAARGKVQKEVFDLVVHDAGGDPRPVERFSVGERALVAEALRLAIAIYSARRSPHPIRTLYRDECDGALQADLAERYPAMLRRALSLGGYERVYLISHREAVWSQADGRIVLRDGRVSLESA